jgi:diadenosine tetraphosphatase ApaH/serine/threonine PP2A family protein phosphatase
VTPLGLIYDVHGNLAALDAVLGDAQQAGTRRFVLGGDYALFGPRPAETVERLRDLDAQWIRGNGERWTAEPSQAPDDEVVQGAISACREELGEGVVQELAGLPETIDREGVLYCHGSPASDVRSFWPEPADDEAELLDGVQDGRLVFGHTHLPFRRRGESGVELVNPGSVGMPFDGDPSAAYAVVRDDGEVEHRRVAYDHAAAAAAVRARFGTAFAETVARRIELARPDV